MATNKIQIDEGSTTNLATNSITEDAVTKHIARSVLNTSAGAEISPATSGKQDTGNTSLGTIDTSTAAATTTLGATSDAAVTAGATGSISAKLRSISRDLIANIVLAAGTNVIGGVTIADGSSATLGAKADAKSTATDTTSITIMSVLKQVSASVQAIATSVSGTLTVASHAVTNAGTFAVQATLQAGTNAIGSILKKDTYAAAQAFTITLASLANSSVGVGRQSTLITGNTTPSALIAVKFTVGTSPTANTLIYVYLIRGDGTLNDDAAGTSDAGLTVKNAPLLGTILVPATTSDTAYYGLFDTKFLGSLGPTFGIAVVNSSGATANSTGGNFTAEYTLIT